jgi:hypothetical protein
VACFTARYLCLTGHHRSFLRLLSQIGASRAMHHRTVQNFKPEEGAMTVNRMVRIIAGTFVLLSLVLGVAASPFYVSSYWLWFTAFVGANLLQSGFTNFCPMDVFLKKFGVRESDPGCA